MSGKRRKACDVELEGLSCFPVMYHGFSVWATTHLFLGMEEKDVDFLEGSKVLNFHSFYLPDVWVSLISGKLISGKKSFTES